MMPGDTWPHCQGREGGCVLPGVALLRVETSGAALRLLVCATLAPQRRAREFADGQRMFQATCS